MRGRQPQAGHFGEFRSDTTQDEIDWLNRYHAVVRERLSPLVSGDALAWLETRTQPI